MRLTTPLPTRERLLVSLIPSLTEYIYQKALERGSRQGQLLSSDRALCRGKRFA